MLALAAIIPKRHRILDHHRERWHLRIRCLHRHVAREEGRHIGHHVADGRARAAESGLHDGVVLGVEMPLYHVANGNVDAWRRVDQGAILVGDFDDVHGDSVGCGRSVGCAGGRHHHAGAGAVLVALHSLGSRHVDACCVAIGSTLVLLGVRSVPHILSSAILSYDTACECEGRDERSDEMHAESSMMIVRCVRRKYDWMIE